jgi:hypothetical protein
MRGNSLYIVFSLLLQGLYELNGQCVIAGLSPTYCVNSPSSGLQVSPAGGTLTGVGLNNFSFDPLLAGAGTHTITYSHCPATYSVEAIPFNQIVNFPTYITLGDDDMSAALPIGFPFRFFCNTYTSFYMSSNGFITFVAGQSNGCCQGAQLPVTSTTSPVNFIACAWTDLDPTLGGTVRYVTQGTAPNRICIAQYNCIWHKGMPGPGPVTTEIILYETTHVIEICTVTKPVPSGSTQFITTMGIQGGVNGPAYTVPGRNASATWTASSDMWRFTPSADCVFNQTTMVNPLPVITASASKKVICAGQTVTINASGGQGYIWSNSQTGPSISISPTATTIYSLSGSDAQGCTNTTTVQITVSGCSDVSDAEMALRSSVIVYPNPTNGAFILSAGRTLRVGVFNQSGAKVRCVELCEANNFTVELNGLDYGLYLIRDVDALNAAGRKILICR